MSRALAVGLVLVALVGCSRQPAAPPQAAAPPEDVTAAPGVAPTLPTPPAPPEPGRPPESGRTVEALLTNLARLTPQEQYDSALLDGLTLLSDRKYPEALNAFEKARAAQDTSEVRREIDKLNDLLAQQRAAAQTLQDIRAVLNDGKADEAARLVAAALQQYGGSDLADELARLKRQADALNADRERDAAARRERLATEARAALADNNLRLASLTLEQAGDTDTELKKTYDDVKSRLTRYDDGRNKAAELRRDPANLEDALAALQGAAQAWDTPSIRQEIDECTLALQKRRDRLSVADFEVRGELGVPSAGRTIAEELLPAFRSRYDLVERGQVSRVLDELHLAASELTVSVQGQQEVGRLARVRYLVLGSITPISGITVQARLVEVKTGLVVQTARLTAPSLDALLPRLPQLAQQLMMTDDQKLDLEQALASNAAETQPVDASIPLPPPPPVPDAEDLPPPLVTYTARPPDLGGLVVADLYQQAPVVNTTAPVAEDVYRRRLLAVQLEVGDNLFRRRQFGDAFKHFSLALNISGPHADIQLRLGNTKRFLPPPVVLAAPVIAAPEPVVAVPAPVVVLPVATGRPRLVVFNFLVNCQPGLVPPATGDWAADHFSSYCGASYEVVERGEVCWYMGRLGITMKDVLDNPGARHCLAEALNVRFFLFGTIEQTASFNVTAHLLDAQTGTKTGMGTIHVQDQAEMKLRMQELVMQTGAAKGDQARLVQASKDSEKSINEARQLLKSGDARRAADVARTALKTSPSNVALQTLAAQAEVHQRQEELEQSRRRAEEARRAEAEAVRKRQEELARQAEAARQKAQAEARTRGVAAIKAEEERKQKAAEVLRAQASQALQAGDHAAAVRALQGAAALRPSDNTAQDLARLKAKTDEAARARAAQEAAQREADLKKQREAAAARVEEERRRRAGEAVRVKAQADQAKAVADARQQEMAKARTAAVATAAASEAEARRKADEAPRQVAFGQAMAQGQAALAAKRYEDAVKAFTNAANLEPGNPTAAKALRDANQALMAARIPPKPAVVPPKPTPPPPIEPRAVAAQRQAEFNRLMTAGKQAAAARRFPEAVKSFESALKLLPDNVEAKTALQKARAGQP